MTLTGLSWLTYSTSPPTGLCKQGACTHTACLPDCPASVLAGGGFMAACFFKASQGSVTDEGEAASESCVS